MKRHSMGSFCLLLAVILSGSGCDGDDIPLFGPQEDTLAPPSSGRFLDSAVANLDYRTPTVSGITDDGGVFTYREGEMVTFSLGNVVLGSTPGKSIITPVNLVPDGNSGTPAVQNIARFLLALDMDDDPGNGITISSDVRKAANNWPSVDFGSDDFEVQLANILGEVSNIYSRTVTLPTASEARYHLEQTIYCAYGGAFSGTFSDPAGYKGEWIALVDSGAGGITGILTTENGAHFELQGRLSADAEGTFSADVYPAGTISSWEGTLSPSGLLKANSGNVSGQKKEAEISVETGSTLYRGSLAKGTVTNLSDIYALSFTVKDSSITARAYSLGRKQSIDVPATLIDADRIQFTLEGIDLLAGGLDGGDYITISGSNGVEQILGTACHFP